MPILCGKLPAAHTSAGVGTERDSATPGLTCARDHCQGACAHCGPSWGLDVFSSKSSVSSWISSRVDRNSTLGALLLGRMPAHTRPVLSCGTGQGPLCFRPGSPAWRGGCPTPSHPHLALQPDQDAQPRGHEDWSREEGQGLAKRPPGSGLPSILRRGLCWAQREWSCPGLWAGDQAGRSWARDPQGLRAEDSGLTLLPRLGTLG